MTDRTHAGPPAPDDRTRDITLPPLPDRPPSALPGAWAGLRPAPGSLDAPTTAVSGPARPPSAPAPAAEPDAADADPAVEADRRLAGRRTDEMAKPPGAAVRERTLAFSSPEMRHRSIEPVRVQPNPRRWPWVVLTLLPILVIVGFGVAWLLLVGGL
jgi:hypothetical protein